MKKQIIAAVAAAAICVGAMGGTFAWLIATPEAVTNTFTVGNNVEITLDEVKVDVLGEVVVGEEAARVKENTYKLMPGHLYTKDPTVHVAENSEPCYVFIKVENGIEGLEAGAADATTRIANQIIANDWIPLSTVEGYEDAKNYYYKENKVDPSKEGAKLSFKVFENFTIDQELEHEELKKYIDDAIKAEKPVTVVIEACAVQADGFGDDDQDDAVAAAVALPEAFYPGPEAPVQP